MNSTHEIVSKRDLAARLGVKPSAISNYIARGKLTPPALRSDGSLDVALAIKQLRGRLDLARQAGRGSPVGETLVARNAPENSAQRTLMRAKAVSAAVAAEQARRKLNEKTGKSLPFPYIKWRDYLADAAHTHSARKGHEERLCILALLREAAAQFAFEPSRDTEHQTASETASAAVRDHNGK